MLKRVIELVRIFRGDKDPALVHECSGLSIIITSILKYSTDWLDWNFGDTKKLYAKFGRCGLQDPPLLGYFSLDCITLDEFAILSEVMAYARRMNIRVTPCMCVCSSIFVLCHEYRHWLQLTRKVPNITSPNSDIAEDDANEFACCCVIDHLEQLSDT